MNKLKVIKVDSEGLEFDNGVKLYSSHDSDCCEHHWLCFKDLTLNDFEGLEFDLTGETFFKRIPDYGIELVPLNGHSVKVPGYGSNNGYYGSNIDLVISNVHEKFQKTFDVSECQAWTDY